MSPKPVIPVAAVALIDRDGRILICRRPDHKSQGGQWEFPGGKIETGETPERAANRELREELGLEPCESCLQPFNFVSHDYGEMHLFMVLFLCRQWDGFANPQEGQTLKWVFPDELEAYDLAPADIPLAREIRDRIPRGSRFAR